MWRVVEAALDAEPNARLCCTGHSLGGSLATLCALDLLLNAPLVRERGCTVISLAGPRFFDANFQKACTALEREGRLRAVRLMVHDDLVPRFPPRALGMMPGIGARLILDPRNDKVGDVASVENDTPNGHPRACRSHPVCFESHTRIPGPWADALPWP